MRQSHQTFIRIFLGVCNTLLAIFGLVIIVASICLIFHDADFKHVIPSVHSEYSLALLALVGALVFLIACVGLFGTIREDPIFLFVFTGCYIVVFLVELTMIISTLVSREELYDYFDKYSSIALTTYRRDGQIRKNWDKLQKDFKCCGATGPENWHIILKYPPGSCSNPHTGAVYQIGCFTKFKETVDAATITVVAVCLIFMIIQLFEMILMT